MFPRAVLCPVEAGAHRFVGAPSPPQSLSFGIHLLEWDGLKFLIFWVSGKIVGTISADPYRSPFMTIS